MEKLYISDLGDGNFKNPILFADYSDPDVIRVGDTFYMTASSFNYVPGLPILTSKDLVNWKLVNYALKNIQFDNYDIPQHAKGVWAPAIRHHDGEFFIYYGMPDEGIFMVKTADPLGQWQEPVCVLEGKGLIDSCPFWDEDGKAYIVHAYAKSRIGFKSMLGIFEMSADGTKAITEDHILYNGVKTQPTIEGPKVYKRDGFYYILAPAGGVKTGWQTALRSKSIYGPFEEKIVLRQGNSPVNGPHQGGLVDTANGDEWFLHFQDRGLYGRICHLQPVKWVDGWPVMGDEPYDEYCGTPLLSGKKPNCGAEEELCYLQASDDFSSDKLALQWQWMGNWKEEFFSLTENPGRLRLYSLNPSGQDKSILWYQANVLTEKLVCPSFECEVALDISSLMENEQAGLVMMGGKYAYLAVKASAEKKSLILSEAFDDVDGLKERVTVLKDLPADCNFIKLGLSLMDTNGNLNFEMHYFDENDTKQKVNTSFFPSDHTWVGAKIGLFAMALDNEKHQGFCDFDYVKVSSND